MNTQLKHDSKNQPIEAAIVRPENFDFDRWAVAVRRQMLAALQKRTGR